MALALPRRSLPALLECLITLLGLIAVSCIWLLLLWYLNAIAFSLPLNWANFSPGMRAFAIFQILMTPVMAFAVYVIARQALGLGRRANRIAVVFALLLLVMSVADILYFQHRLLLAFSVALGMNRSGEENLPATVAVFAVMTAGGYLLLMVRYFTHVWKKQE